MSWHGLGQWGEWEGRPRPASAARARASTASAHGASVGTGRGEAAEGVEGPPPSGTEPGCPPRCSRGWRCAALAAAGTDPSRGGPPQGQLYPAAVQGQQRARLREHVGRVPPPARRPHPGPASRCYARRHSPMRPYRPQGWLARRVAAPIRRWQAKPLAAGRQRGARLPMFPMHQIVL